MLLLNVPFQEKDEAKALGAKWNPNLKKWYVQNREDYHKFYKWIPNEDGNFHICSNNLYIAVGEQSCFRCNQITRVVGAAYGELAVRYFDDEKDTYVYLEFEEELIHIFQITEELPKEIIQCIENNFCFKNIYSKTTQSSSLSSYCEHCGVLQGNYFLFSEPSSPFILLSEEEAENLRIYQCPLPYDFVAENEGFDSTDFLIKERAQFFVAHSLAELNQLLANDKNHRRN